MTTEQISLDTRPKNLRIPYMGGFVELVPSGPVEFTDENGVQKRIMNDRHVRFSGAYGKSKLACSEVLEIVSLLEHSEVFFKWCSECSVD